MKPRKPAAWAAAAAMLLMLALSLQTASAQPGFLSLDCGATAPYVNVNNISWVPDTAYMSLGSTAAVTLNPSIGATGQELSTLRYFPDATRASYCYVLPAKLGQTYLVRPSFFHGGYDARPTVSFDVYVDTYQVTKPESLTATFVYNWQEYIVRASADNIQVCLVRTVPTSTPFISALELRPLDAAMYAKVQDGSALVYAFRSNYGNNPYILRYPQDPYDRYWIDVAAAIFPNVTSTGVVDSGLAVDKPPPGVMNTAVETPPTKTRIDLTFPLTDHTSFYYLAVYFAELQALTAGQTRVFDVTLNSQPWVSGLNVYSAANNAVNVPVEITLNNTIMPPGDFNVSLHQTNASTLGPLVNGAELFYVHLPEGTRTLAGDVLAIGSMKTAFNLTSWTGDPCLFVPYNWVNCTTNMSPPRVSSVVLSKSGLTGPIPPTIGDLTNLTSLWLDNNALTGEIPDLSKMTNLQQLHLENNNLTGPIPGWLASMPNLQGLYLQNNQLSGDVPKALLNNPALTLQIMPGNVGLCANVTCGANKSNSSNVGLIVGIVVGVIAAAAVAAGLFVYCLCFAKKRKPPPPPPNAAEIPEASTANRNQNQYTLAQVMAATNNHARLLGSGGFGPVYYGRLPGGQEVAVKVSAKGSGQGSREFLNEVQLLTRVHHKNLVPLVGYCKEGDNLVLIYEYMPNGTVQEHLYGKTKGLPGSKHLDWKTRVSIALNAAQGLEYLHVGCNPAIFHRDVKSNNILLTDKWVAKVADFGLSKSTNTNEKVTHVSTLVKGTIGYLDPEYFNTNQLTTKSDVYSFGVVLLELICGRQPFDPSLPENQRRIDQWVRPHLQAGNLEEIVDPALGSNYNVESMWKMADLAMSSVEPKSAHRPDMSTVVQELRDTLMTEESSGPRPEAADPAARPNHHPQSSNIPSSASGSQMDVLSFMNAR